jgi:hypothetical protein
MAKKLIDITEVEHTYNGKQGMCCCGCSGNHRYHSSFEPTKAEKARGYKVMPDEVSDRSVLFVLRKVNEAIAADTEERGGNYIAANGTTRVYIVYLKEA